MGYSLAASSPGEIEGATVSLREGAIEAMARGMGNCDPYAEDALDDLLDYLQAQSGRVWLQEESVSLQDEVALSGLSGLINALRIQENQP
jgi:hypothetical protein